MKLKTWLLSGVIIYIAINIMIGVFFPNSIISAKIINNLSEVRFNMGMTIKRALVFVLFILLWTVAYKLFNIIKLHQKNINLNL